MTVRIIISFVLVGIFPMFQTISYETFRRKSQENFSLRKRNPGLVYLTGSASLLVYANLCISIFGGTWCCVYHIINILVAPISVGPQLLRGILLWGMLEHNRLILEYNLQYEQAGLRRRSSRSLPSQETATFNEELKPNIVHTLSESNAMANQAPTSKDKALQVKNKMRLLVHIAFRALLIIPIILIFILVITSSKAELTSTDFEGCFPEPKVIEYAGRPLGLVIALLTLVVIIIIRRCNDEIGIRREITSNVLILFVSYVLIFIMDLSGYSTWQSVLQVIQQMVLTVSMVLIPIFHPQGAVMSWIQSKRKRAILGYGQPIPTISPRRTSMLNRRMSADARAIHERSKLESMSLDTGFLILLSNTEGLRAFTEHCSREFSVENIYFWCAVNEYHTAVDCLRAPGCEDKALGTEEHDLRSFAKEIFDTYVQTNAEYQVNISSAQRILVQSQLLSTYKIPRDIFDKAQRDVFAVMSRDSYPRFLASDYEEKAKRNILARNLRVLPS